MTPLTLRYPAPDGRIRRCLGCDRPMHTKGRKWQPHEQGARASWCVGCTGKGSKQNAPALPLLTWAGIERATAIADRLHEAA